MNIATILINPEMIGLAFHQLRTERGVTLREISDATGLSVSFLSDMERGRVKPSLDTVARLARYYGFEFRIAF